MGARRAFHGPAEDGQRAVRGVCVGWGWGGGGGGGGGGGERITASGGGPLSGAPRHCRLPPPAVASHAQHDHAASLPSPPSPQGSIVRAIRRLEEVLRQLAGALRAVGDLEAAQRFEAASERIKRDIVFAASLYL